MCSADKEMLFDILQLDFGKKVPVDIFPNGYQARFRLINRFMYPSFVGNIKQKVQNMIGAGGFPRLQVERWILQYCMDGADNVFCLRKTYDQKRVLNIKGFAEMLIERTFTVDPDFMIWVRWVRI